MKGKSILLCSRERSYTKFAISICVISVFLFCGGISAVYANAPMSEKIVFTSTRDGNSEIYIMNSDGSEQINLSRDNAEDFDPVWSPDGEQILFVSDRAGPSDLYIMNVDGSGVRKVFRNRKNRLNPTWSPDGRKIAYAQGNEVGDFIYTATINGGFVERLTHGFMPTWSPDGSKIAFVARDPRGTPLGIFNLRTHTKKMLLSNKILWGLFPSWSPRGDKIAFSKIDGKFDQGFLSWTQANIYIVNRDGTGLHQIIKDEAAVAMEPTWSPHGDEIVYTDGGRAFTQLFKTDMGNSRPVQLTHEGENFEADWFNPTALDVLPSEQLLTTFWGKIKVN